MCVCAFPWLHDAYGFVILSPFRLLAKRRKKNYWGFSVNCTGNEADLSECKLGREIVMNGNNTCEQGMPVVVSCVPGRAFAPSVSAGFRKAYRVEVGALHCGSVASHQQSPWCKSHFSSFVWSHSSVWVGLCSFFSVFSFLQYILNLANAFDQCLK